jgi:amicyanin
MVISPIDQCRPTSAFTPLDKTPCYYGFVKDKEARMRYVAGLVIIALIAGGVFLIASRDDQGDTSSNQTSESTTQPQAPPANDPSPTSADKVNINNLVFSPADITVKKGTTVTWTNSDSVAHTVTADTGSGPNSQMLENGQSYSFTFNEVGTFSYHCTPHPQMQGSVKVTE